MSPELQTDWILSRKINGHNISIMSRQTDRTGKNIDPRIIKGVNYDFRIQALAPTISLIRNYYKQKIDWEGFEERYIDLLQNKYERKWVDFLVNLTFSSRVSIRCIEETPEKCHRRLLAKECQKIEPNLLLTLH